MMTQKAAGAIVLALGLLVQSTGFATPPALPPFPPLKLAPPEPVRVMLDNGLIVYLLEDHELPLIRLQMNFAGGTQYDPMTKIGLGSVFGEAMSYGGSARFSPEQIEQLLDRKAASINFSIDLENGTGHMSCRTEDFEQIFDVFQDLLLHPQFRKDKFDIVKAKAREGLRRMNDDPDTVSRREFRRLLYGSSHPYACETHRPP